MVVKKIYQKNNNQYFLKKNPMLTNFTLATILVVLSIGSLYGIDALTSVSVNTIKQSRRKAVEIKNLSEHFSHSYNQYQKNLQRKHTYGI